MTINIQKSFLAHAAELLSKNTTFWNTQFTVRMKPLNKPDPCTPVRDTWSIDVYHVT